MRRGRCRYSQRVWSRANWGAVNDTADSWSSQGYDAVDGEYSQVCDPAATRRFACLGNYKIIFMCIN